MLDSRGFARHQIGSWGVCAFDRLPFLINCRAKSRIPENARSVIVCLLPFYAGDYPGRNVARYALGGDYHRLGGDILRAIAGDLEREYPEDAFASFLDNSPIPEVEAARLAGLGVVGDHFQLIHQRYGSYVFIGTIVTTLKLEPSIPEKGSCLRCGRCIAACPTGALSDKGLAPALCRSFITQKKGSLTQWEQEQISAGGMAWGCDICSDACPLNQNPEQTPIPVFARELDPRLTLDKLERMMKTKAYGYRGRAVLERNLKLIRPE